MMTMQCYSVQNLACTFQLSSDLLHILIIFYFCLLFPWKLVKPQKWHEKYRGKEMFFIAPLSACCLHQRITYRTVWLRFFCSALLCQSKIPKALSFSFVAVFSPTPCFYVHQLDLAGEYSGGRLVTHCLPAPFYSFYTFMCVLFLFLLFWFLSQDKKCDWLSSSSNICIHISMFFLLFFVQLEMAFRLTTYLYKAFILLPTSCYDSCACVFTLKSQFKKSITKSGRRTGRKGKSGWGSA